jgi:hypothetical protein
MRQATDGWGVPHRHRMPVALLLVYRLRTEPRQHRDLHYVVYVLLEVVYVLLEPPGWSSLVTSGSVNDRMAQPPIGAEALARALRNFIQA